MFAIDIEDSITLKYHMFSEKKNTLSLSIGYSKCGHEYKKMFKKEESIEILKILGLLLI